MIRSLPGPALLTNRSLAGAPAQTNEMLPDGLYGKTVPGIVSAAGSDAEGLVLASHWSKCSQRGAKPPSHLGFFTSGNPSGDDTKPICLIRTWGSDFKDQELKTTVICI